MCSPVFCRRISSRADELAFPRRPSLTSRRSIFPLSPLLPALSEIDKQSRNKVHDCFLVRSGRMPPFLHGSGCSLEWGTVSKASWSKVEGYNGRRSLFHSHIVVSSSVSCTLSTNLQGYPYLLSQFFIFYFLCQPVTS